MAASASSDATDGGPRAATLALVAAAVLAAAALPAAGQLAVRADTLYTLAGPPIEDGVVLLRDGKVAAVGPAAEVEVPAGVRTLHGRVVTPGLVDAHSVVGLAGILNIALGTGGLGGVVAHDQDQLDRSEPVQPELRALDAFDVREPLVEWVRSLGVTTLHTGHGPGAPVSGQTMIVKTAGETAEGATIRPAAMIAISLGLDGLGEPPLPGSRAKAAAMVRKALLEAREYRRRTEAGDDPAPPRDLRKEALAALLSGELSALVTAQRSTAILTALRLAREFGFRLVLDGAAEAPLVLEEIRAAGVPVVLHPTTAHLLGNLEHASYATAAELHEAGIPFAIQSGYELYVPPARSILFEAAVAAAHGLPYEEALAAITLYPARILGIDDRVGSLEPGKDADLVLYDGDPFEYTSHVCGVVIDGELVSETCR